MASKNVAPRPSSPTPGAKVSMQRDDRFMTYRLASGTAFVLEVKWTRISALAFLGLARLPEFDLPFEHDSPGHCHHQRSVCLSDDVKNVTCAHLGPPTHRRSVTEKSFIC